MSTSTSKKLAAILAPIIVFLGSYGLRNKEWAIPDYPSKPTIEEELQIAAQKLNEEAPKKIDSITTFKRATAGPGRRISYYYILKIEPSDQDLTNEQMERLTQSVRNKLCHDPELDVMKKNNVL